MLVFRGHLNCKGYTVRAMKNGASMTKLVERAQRGDTEGLNRLAGAVKARLYEYTVRMTLDEQLSSFRSLTGYPVFSQSIQFSRPRVVPANRRAGVGPGSNNRCCQYRR